MLALDLGNVDDGDVESAAAQVVYRDLAVAFPLIQAEGDGRGGWLVDDALDLEAGDLAGILGGLALTVVEIGRHGDDGLGDFLAKIIFRRLLHLAQDFGGYLGRRHFLAAHFHPGVVVVRLDDLEGHHVDVLLHFLLLETAADQALDSKERILGVRDCLALGRCTAQDFTILGVGDDGRGRACALGVLDDLGLATLHDGHAGVGGAEVDTDDFSHDDSLNALSCVVNLVFDMGFRAAFSSALGLRDDDQRRPDHPFVEGIPLLQHAEHPIGFSLRFERADCLMLVRVEFLARRVDFGQAGLFEGGDELLQGQVYAAPQALGRTGGGGQRGLQTVPDRQHFGGELLGGVFVRFGDVFLGPPAQVFRFSLGAQPGIMVFGGFQFSLPQQFLRAGQGFDRAFLSSGGFRFRLAFLGWRQGWRDGGGILHAPSPWDNPHDFEADEVFSRGRIVMQAAISRFAPLPHAPGRPRIAR